MVSTLEELPVEAIACILNFLDVYDLVTVSMVNHFFREVITTFPQLQYRFSLQLACMVDNGRSGEVELRNKLAEVERRERAWRTVNLSNKTNVKVKHQTSHIYDLSGGTYVLGDCKRAVTSRNTFTLRHFDLSKCGEGRTIIAEDWPELRVESDIVDMGLSLSEFDLIAIVGLSPSADTPEKNVVLSLRELGTGRPHPLAKQPDMILGRASGSLGKLSIMMEVVGPRLVLLLTWNPQSARMTAGERNVLYCINWWDGAIIAAEPSQKIKWDGFVYLSSDIILLPNREGRLEVVRLPSISPDSQTNTFTRLAAFILPETQPICALGIVQCRAEPNPTGPPHPALQTDHADFAARLRARKRSPIVPDPAKALVLFQLYYREYASQEDAQLGMWGVLRHNVSLAIHRATLLDIVQEATKNKLFLSQEMLADIGIEITGPAVPIIPWSFWGPKARWHANDVHVSNWITVAAGQRYIGTHQSGCIVVKDYNPYTVARARAYLKARPRHETETNTLYDDEDTEDEEEIDTEMYYVNPNPEVDSFNPIDYSPSEDAHDINDDEDFDFPIPVPPPASDSVNSGPSNVSAASGTGDEEDLDPTLDSSWANVRLVEGYDVEESSELARLFKSTKESAGPLPCVEFWSKEAPNYHGYLMDEERIIGLKYEEHGTISSFDVYTL